MKEVNNMRYIIVSVSATTYPAACEKLANEVNAKMKEGYCPNGNMNIVYDEHRFQWHASQPVIFQ